MSCIWIVWSTLYVYLWGKPSLVQARQGKYANIYFRKVQCKYKPFNIYCWTLALFCVEIFFFVINGFAFVIINTSYSDFLTACTSQWELKIGGVRIIHLTLCKYSTHCQLRIFTWSKHKIQKMNKQDPSMICIANEVTPPRTPRINRLKSQIMKPTFLS